MFVTAHIWACSFYLLLFRFNQFALTNPAENRQSLDGLRPAKAECERYKKIISELGQTAQTADANSKDLLAKPGEFPYMAAVGYSIKREKSEERKYPCAGILVSEKHVITAAHCTSNSIGDPVEVMLGATDHDNANQKQGVQRISISRIIRHPQYDGKLRYFDIAILELEEPIELTMFVRPACLMTELLTTETEGANSSLVVLTWRRSDLGEDELVKLVKVGGQKFVETSECSKIYDRNVSRNLPNGLDDGMICVTKSDDNVEGDACQGISGAPVLVPSTKYGFLTAGFSAFGYPCAANFPSVAVSVYKYLDWIENQVWTTKAL